jgi:hypothetical protein
MTRDVASAAWLLRAGHDALVASSWASGGTRGGPSGYTYAGLAVRLDGGSPGHGSTREDLLAALAEIRFTGWVGPREDGWVLSVPSRGDGTVAAGRRGVLGVGEWIARRLVTTVVAARVVNDRQLLLAVWSDGDEVGRYVSDPSHGLGQDDVLPDPVGVEHADAFAAAVGRPEAADELAELLAEEFDAESVIESERLVGVLRLLGLPGWLVAASSLPRNVPGGPGAREFTRLGVGTSGLRGRVLGRAAEVVRARRRPPPAITDPPRSDPSAEPWMF